MKKISLSLATAVIIVLSACGSSPAPSSDNSDLADQSQPGKEKSWSEASVSTAAKEYFDAYAASEPEEMRAASENAVQGSAAQAYMIHQANVIEANDATGYERYVQEAHYNDGSVSVCYEGDECGEFADITFEGNKLSSFTVDGRDVFDRIALGDGSVVKYKNNAGFEVLSSYQSAEDSLFAVVRFYAYDRPINFSYIPTYRKPGGQQIDSTDSDLPSRVAANSNQFGVLIFPNSEIGGDLHLKLSNADNEDEVSGGHIFETVEVPLPRS